MSMTWRYETVLSVPGGDRGPGLTAGWASTRPGRRRSPAGSPLGDALNAAAAAVDCARRNFGHGPQMTWPLAGRLGLARFLMPAPAS
jgi:hypothetical protein